MARYINSNSKPSTFNLASLNSKLLASGSKVGRRIASPAVYQEQADLSKLIFIIIIFLLLAFALLVLFTDNKNMGKYLAYKTDTVDMGLQSHASGTGVPRNSRSPGVGLEFNVNGTQSSGWDRITAWFKCDRRMCADLPNATQQTPGITNSTTGYDESRQCWTS